MVIGILWQAYLISLRSGQYLNGTRVVAGFIAAILIIFGLVFWIRHEKQPEKKDKNFVRIPVIGALLH